MSNSEDTSESEKGASKPRFQFKPSTWSVNEFKVLGGDGMPLCRCAVLRMPDSLLLWVGSDAEPMLGALAFGVPATGEDAGQALASVLMSATGNASGADGVANSLARRLSVRLARPVYVCCGDEFDQITLPLIEYGIMAVIKNRPHFF